MEGRYTGMRHERFVEHTQSHSKCCHTTPCPALSCPVLCCYVMFYLSLVGPIVPPSHSSLASLSSFFPWFSSTIGPRSPPHGKYIQTRYPLFINLHPISVLNGDGIRPNLLFLGCRKK